MFLNEYTVHEHRKDLLREADQQRLARELAEALPLTQRMGQSLLKLGARLIEQETDACFTVENRTGQTVTVCPA
jgi:hypothetical protein